jgi:hypothetical protein
MYHRDLTRLSDHDHITHAVHRHSPHTPVLHATHPFPLVKFFDSTVKHKPMKLVALPWSTISNDRPGAADPRLSHVFFLELPSFHKWTRYHPHRIIPANNITNYSSILVFLSGGLKGNPQSCKIRTQIRMYIAVN